MLRDVCVYSDYAVRANFIKNESGNDIIPFAGIGFGFYGESLRIGKYDLGGNGLNAALVGGFDWYPFGQIFALQVGYIVTAADITMSGGSQNASASYRTSGLNVGYVLSF